MPRRRRRANNGELLELCYNRGNSHTTDSWENVIQWLNANKHNKKRFTASVTYTNKDDTIEIPENMTSLQLMVSLHPPPVVVEILMHHAPETVTQQDDTGDLPLHDACTGRASSDVVRLLLEAYPEGVHVQNHRGHLPLHYASCNDGASLDVLDLLTRTFPGSIDVKDNDNNKPSYYLIRRGPRGRNDYLDRNLSVFHDAVSTNSFSIHLVKLLLEAFPELCVAQDDNGRTPLHLACARNAPMDVALALLEVNPDSSTITDNHGRTPSPSQLMKQAASQMDENGMCLLHHEASRAGGLAANSLKFIFSAYPEGITLPDKHGNLPFHYACLNVALSIDVLMLFIKLNPESISFNTY